MTTEKLIQVSRSLARVSDLSLTDEDCVDFINIAIEDFSREVGGIERRSVLQGATSFALPANGFIRVNGASLILTTTLLEEVSGQAIAESFNAINSAVATLSYSSDSFRFTLETPGVDVHLQKHPGLCMNEYLFGTFEHENEEDDDSWLAGYPKEDKFFVTLETSYTDIGTVKWNGKELEDRNFRPDGYGNPYYFNARADRIYIMPHPRSQGIVSVNYTGFPSGIEIHYIPDEQTQEPTDVIDVIDPVPLSNDLHKTIAYFLASKMAETEHDYKVADRMLALYNRDVGRYLVEKSNANPDIGFGVLY